MKSQITMIGYDLLGQDGNEGIRYVWKKADRVPLLECAAFVNKTKGKQEHISGYTTSVSMGCILRQLGLACKFCRTGTILPYSDMLSAFDIAKENILMVLMDMKRPFDVDLSNQEREFAYMGQGEPGYSYPQVRLAIKLTDYAMHALGQKVHRHIISTSGIPEMLYTAYEDIKNDYFDSKITLHFSLHSTILRSNLMPINNKYPYQDVLIPLRKISNITGEKICIGILLFKEFSCKNSSFKYTTSMKEIDELLTYIDSKHFRISLCEYNHSPDVGVCKPFKIEDATKILNYIENKGYEVKLFSSYGQKENTACGMLGGQKPQLSVTEDLINLETYADKLILEAYSKIK